MANYNTLVCFGIEATLEQRQKLQELFYSIEEVLNEEEGTEDRKQFFDEMFGEGNYDYPYITFRYNDGKLLLSSDSPDLEVTARLLQHFLREEKDDRAITFQWAETCDKDRTDAFGGGACHLTRSEIKWMSSHDWLSQFDRRGWGNLRNQDKNTVLAALQFYLDKGQGDPDMREDLIHEISVGMQVGQIEDTSLTDDGIEELIERLRGTYNV